MPDSVQHFSGEAFFIDDSDRDTAQVIFKNGTVVVEYHQQDGWRYTASLDSSGDGNLLSGEWVATKGGETDRGRANARLYTSGTEQLLLGNWQEDDTNHKWFVLLEPAENGEGA